MSRHTIEIDDREFQSTVLESDRPVLVDFWAPWCGPCRVVAPLLDELAAQYGDDLVIAKLNTDQNQEQAFRLGIQGIPTMVLFKDGIEVDRLVGALPKGPLQQWIDRRIAA